MKKNKRKKLCGDCLKHFKPSPEWVDCKTCPLYKIPPRELVANTKLVYENEGIEAIVKLLERRSKDLRFDGYSLWYMHRLMEKHGLWKPPSKPKRKSRQGVSRKHLRLSHYKRNRVCFTCRVKRTTEVCQTCQSNTQYINYEVPRKNSIRRWKQLEELIKKK